MAFTVGFKRAARTDRVVVDADDALAAALEVKAQYPEAAIMYSRPRNKRGDARNPVMALNSEGGTTKPSRN